MKAIAIVVSALLLALPVQAETLQDGEKAEAALGFGGGGQFLISNVTNACDAIAKVMAKAAPEDRILFMTDAETSFVRHGSCDRDCDLLTVNNLMAPCQAETGAICAPFAGLTQGTLYDLSIDPTGASLSDCGL